MKEILGATAVAIALASYVPYIASMLRGHIKPHAFSWFLWSLLTGISCVIQMVEGGGPGAWVSAVSSAVPLLIAALSLKYGEKEITRGDWITFLSGIAAIPLWYITKNPLWSLLLVILIDALGFYPTYRKSFHKPHEEQALMYVLSGLKHFISLFALANFTLTTALYPAALVVMNGAFTVMLFVRRRVLRV